MTTYVVPIIVLDENNIEEWKKYMRKQHIPLVLKTEYPLKHSGKIYREKPIDGKPSNKFQVHYFFQNEAELADYRKNHGLALKEDYENSGWDKKAPVGERYIQDPEE